MLSKNMYDPIPKKIGQFLLGSLRQKWPSYLQKILNE